MDAGEVRVELIEQKVSDSDQAVGDGTVVQSLQLPVPVGEFEPFTRYNQFGDSSINFSVILRVQTFADRYLTTHEFMKRLHARYAKEGIEIPFPQRVVTTRS